MESTYAGDELAQPTALAIAARSLKPELLEEPLALSRPEAVVVLLLEELLELLAHGGPRGGVGGGDNVGGQKRFRLKKIL